MLAQDFVDNGFKFFKRKIFAEHQFNQMVANAADAQFPYLGHFFGEGLQQSFAPLGTDGFFTHLGIKGGLGDHALLIQHIQHPVADTRS